MAKKKPVLLVILDGWGYREDPQYNAIAQAHTPNWDALWQQYPHTLIRGSGTSVGLPDGQMGNSEVGHLNLGAGRLVPQDYGRVNLAIDDGSFFDNAVLTDAVNAAKQQGGAIHILGLLSPGGVHSHQDHILAMARMAANQGVQDINLHAFLDGRDTPPQSAKQSLQQCDALFKELACGQVASIIGRYYAMDRDNRWSRVQAAYDLLTQGKATYHCHSAVDALQQAYDRGETDEFVQATSIHADDAQPACIKDNDVVIFMNFRADRARELTRAFTEKQFDGFERETVPTLSRFVSLTEYAADIDTAIAFPPIELNNVLGDVLAKQGLKQLRIAETEKYAHVTFFFNGGREQVFENEQRILVPSPDVATYDLQPQMHAEEVTEHLLQQIAEQQQDVIICNFANPDMVGHTGNFDATVKAVETMDHCLAKLHQALQQYNGVMIVTADHGNAEKMFDEQTGQAHTAHTSEPVPCVITDEQLSIAVNDGKLSDIAPTILYLLGIEQPQEMTGQPLVQ